MTPFRKAYAALCVLALAAFGVSAQNPWLHVYSKSSNGYTGLDMSTVSDISFNEESGTMTVNGADGEQTLFRASSIDHFNIGPNVPAIYITTDEYISEVTSKSVYVTGMLKLDTRGLGEDLEMSVNLRGRGNSTWNYPKKPYRIKFAEKQRMMLPKKAKNFVLLANYIDPSLMRNFVAFKFGEVIQMPWINHAQAVDVYLNDNYKGSYMLTEKVGFNNGSVDLKSADEVKSIMFEFDTNTPNADEISYDSKAYNSDLGLYLPVRIKDPDCPYSTADSIKMWQEKWFNDLDNFMSTIDSGDTSAIFEACDLESLVRYIMVFNLACNQELNHPKSVYIFKTEGGKYQFGPCWDFDWAYGYQPTYSKGQSGNDWWWGGSSTSYPSYENPLLGCGVISSAYNNDGYSGYFFYALCNNSVFMNRFREVWDEFYRNGQTEFWNAFEEYAAALEPSSNLQGSNYTQSFTDFKTHIDDLRSWVRNRIEFINSDPNMGLWEDDSFE